MAWPCGRSRMSQVLVLFMVTYLLGVLYVLLPLGSPDSSASNVQQLNIDEVIRGRWGKSLDAGLEPGSFRPRDCRPRRDLAFIKCMKCATETLGTVFRRYGYRHNLSVVLPVQKRIYLGWPFPITPLDYRPSSRGYGLLMEHAVYNGTFMRKLMNPGTVFLTMIRQPLDLFVSTLNYFNVFELANVTVRHGMEAVHEYLSHIQHYEAVYKSPAAAPKRYCIPDGFSITKNLLSHCLGMPLGFPPGASNIDHNFTAVTDYIKRLDSEFLLVMIMEYFEESLVLLRRLMCWEVKDVLHHSANQGSYRRNISWHVLTDADRQTHGQWSRLDYLLYDHFNRTFWRKVHAQGEDFHHEVAYFKNVQRQVTSFCRNITPYGESYIRFPESRWSPPFNFSTEDCRLMVAPLLNMLKDRYQRQESAFANFSTDSVSRQFLPLC